MLPTAPTPVAEATSAGTFALALGAFVVAVALLAYALLRFKAVARWITAAILIVFPWAAITTDWNWFDWAKRYSVVIPMFLMASMHAQPDRPFSRLVARAMPYILMLNVAEAALLELLGRQFWAGALLLVIAVATPLRFSWDLRTGLLGFRDPLWQLAYVLSLLRLFVTCAEFEDSFVGTTSVLVLASVASLLLRNDHAWPALRLTTLYLLLVQDSLFPTLSRLLYPTWAQPQQRIRFFPDVLDTTWLTITSVLVGGILWQRLAACRERRARPVRTAATAKEATPPQVR